MSLTLNSRIIMKRLITCCLATLFLGFNSFAQKGDKEYANYAISVGISPFGGGLNLTYHHSERTSINIGMGGFAEGEAPLSPTIDELGDDFTLTASSSWMGLFLSHQPFQKTAWFRVNTGLAVGSIENTIVDGVDTFKAYYKENPVAYFGINVGTPAYKGLIYGLDLGMLFSSGPEFNGPDGDKLDAIEGSAFFGPVLPNFQLTVGYGF